MIIGVLQGSSQKDKNPLLVSSVCAAVKEQGHRVVNFGIFPEEEITFSYVQTALCVSLLLESKVIDFAVTGCSSGQGMMLACNGLPGVLCGYVEQPSDAYLFGRINDGNAVSYPLGLNFGWAAEINLKSTMEQLFREPFGTGYPKEEGARKRKDTALLKTIHSVTKRSIMEVLPELDSEFVHTTLQRENVYDFIMQNSKNDRLKQFISQYRE